ncbi:hypothetical protein NDU88_003368 [Pleurodeles waltl]|uniref:Uncharacterized protein n=1 Tax=Pleurodeles waltl TaxID=8319 RepID=A0AAV7UY89_PLEWA|nr:hypothetical protein NDU88_003368 [Pleurodeles waltl]
MRVCATARAGSARYVVARQPGHQGCRKVGSNSCRVECVRVSRLVLGARVILLPGNKNAEVGKLGLKIAETQRETDLRKNGNELGCSHMLNVQVGNGPKRIKERGDMTRRVGRTSKQEGAA